MTIRRSDISEPIEWTVENLVENFGVDPEKAEFIVAINTGELLGDIVEDRRPLDVVLSSTRKQKESDTTLRAASSRIPMWVNRYNDVVNTAKIMAGGDKKLVWRLGPTEHCSSCLKLAGQVRRASMWAASGIQPQHPGLRCGGWNCQCSLNPTTESLSRGRMPSLP